MNVLALAGRMACGCAVLGAVGCTGPQSALDPAGAGGDRLAALFWWMIGGSAVVWAAFTALTLYAMLARRAAIGERAAIRLVVVGGVVVPVLVLTVLLLFGLAMIPRELAPAPPGALRIEVVGEQWWWRVRYLPSQGTPVDTANEIHLPLGQPVEFLLESPDVIHSFWIPPLGGKMDMIPGHRTRLTLTPTRTGTFRGVCAEYCGASHAWMAFDVVVHEAADFERWLEAERAPAVASIARGSELFHFHGCGACHAIRGTDAGGTVGPDLTHVGSRRTLGAGRTRMGADELRQWIAHTDELKPGVLMPEFGMLPEADIDALATYLEGLK